MSRGAGSTDRVPNQRHRTRTAISPSSTVSTGQRRHPLGVHRSLHPVELAAGGRNLIEARHWCRDGPPQPRPEPGRSSTPPTQVARPVERLRGDQHVQPLVGGRHQRIAHVGAGQQGRGPGAQSTETSARPGCRRRRSRRPGAPPRSHPRSSPAAVRSRTAPRPCVVDGLHRDHDHPSGSRGSKPQQAR